MSNNLHGTSSYKPIESKYQSKDSVELNVNHDQSSSYNGPIVNGAVSSCNRACGRRCLGITTPVVALASGAALYAWSAGINAGNYDDRGQHQITPLANGLWAAAGTVIGAALTGLATWGVDWYRRRSESKILAADPSQVPARLVDRAVKSRFLTLSGLKTQVAKLEKVLAGKPPELAKALAALAEAVPVGRSDRCMPCGDVSREQLDFLLLRLQSIRGLTPKQLDQALLHMGESLRGRALRRTEDTKAVLLKLLAPVVGAVGPRDPAGIRRKAALVVDLRGLDHFQRALQMDSKTVKNYLELDAQTYALARPHFPIRASDGKGVSDSKGAPQGGPAYDIPQPGTQMSRQGIVNLLIALCASKDRDLNATQQGRITQLLALQPGDEPGVRAAKSWARLLFSHWPDDKRAAGSLAVGAAGVGHQAGLMLETLLATDKGLAKPEAWADAPCSIREALGYMARAYPNAATLNALASKVCALPAIHSQLSSPGLTLVEDLHKEVGFAIGIAQSQAKPSERARYLIGIMDALARRAMHSKDVPGDMFITGLLSPQEVVELATAVSGETELAPGDKALLISRLPQLCQASASLQFAQEIYAKAKGLVSAESENHLEVLVDTYANSRIVPSDLGEPGISADTLLHIAGLTRYEQGAVSEALTQIVQLSDRDFLNPEGLNPESKSADS